MLISDRRFSQFGDQAPEQDNATPQRPSIVESLKQARDLARPYWQSNARRFGIVFALLTISLTLFGVGMSVAINHWYNNFYNALQDKNASEFWRLIFIFCGLAFAAIIAAVYRLYFQSRLILIWREWMTRRWLEDWMQGSAHWRIVTLGLRNDNPDQRITEDIRSFVNETVQLLLGLLNAGVTLASFVTLLWTLGGSLDFTLIGRQWHIPGFMVWAALFYAIGGSLLTYHIGRPLVRLNFLQERLEANFRYNLARVREHGEAIALQQGENAEIHGAQQRFGQAVANTMRVILRSKKLTWMNSFYGQTAVIAPFFFAAPKYLAGAFALGTLMQITSAFGRVQDALSWFVDAYSSIASWQATVQRLHGLSQSIAQSRNHIRPVEETHNSGPDLHTYDLSVSTPTGTALNAVPHTLHFSAGQRYLIEGASGCGKSTWLRTLAGLWPYAQGRIDWPTGQRLFVPQKPYLPHGRLIDVLCYPQAPGSLSEEQAQSLLQDVGLPALQAELGHADHWQDRLSLGEQQRLAFARVLHMAPQWVFMDEATSALDVNAEVALYQTLFAALPDSTFISIGHRPSLQSLHQHTIHFGLHVNDKTTTSPGAKQ